MQFMFPPSAPPFLPVIGASAVFPVHRVYCVGRNYVEHAQEMGATGREPPFFFMKPADAVCYAGPTAALRWPYPSLSHNVHHEIELVVAIGTGGKNIALADAQRHIFGYAVGLDMTRRDLQNDMKKQGRPWCIGKGFDASAPIAAITPVDAAGKIENARIALTVNQQERQRGTISQLIWSIAETIAQISSAWELQAGDLIFTGTPAGVGAVSSGDVLCGTLDGLEDVVLHVV